MWPARRLKKTYVWLNEAAGRFARLDKLVWIGIVALFCAVWALRTWSKFDPGMGDEADYASSFAGTVYDAAGMAQAVIATLILVLPALRLVFTRNPAEILAVRKLSRTYPEVISDLRYIIRRNQVPFNADQVKIVSNEEELELISQMNSEAFETSGTYSGSLNEKRLRNASLFKVYPKCFALIHDRNQALIGFSIVTPLNTEATDYYKAGHISDLGLAGYHLAKPGQRAGALLLFAIGLQPEFEAKRGGAHRAEYIRQLLRCHVLHASQVAKDFSVKELEFIAQVEKPSIKRLLQSFGFVALPGKGRDGDALFAVSWLQLAQIILKSAPPEQKRSARRQN